MHGVRQYVAAWPDLLFMCHITLHGCVVGISVVLYRGFSLYLIEVRGPPSRGIISLVYADNLASQLVGGYKTLHSAFSKLHYCMATDRQMQEN